MKEFEVVISLSNGSKHNFVTRATISEEVFTGILHNGEIYRYTYGVTENQVRVAHISHVRVAEIVNGSGPEPV